MAILMAKERRIMLEMAAELRRDVISVYFAKARGRMRRRTIDTLSEILQGHILGRGATASSLSKATDTPYASTLRRVESLIAAGLVERKGNSYCVNEEIFNSPEALAMVQKSISRIVATAEKLKKIYPK